MRKAISVINIFGVRYFLYLSSRFVSRFWGQRSSIQDVCARHGVKCVIITGNINDEPYISALENAGFDVLVSIAGSQIFRARALGAAKKYFLNVHNAMLPKCRGLMPVFWTLHACETPLGVSVFKMNEGIDTGPILKQVEVPIEDRSLDKAIKATKVAGMVAVNDVLADILHGRETLLPNDDSVATYNSFPTKADVKEFLARGNKLL